MALSLCSHSMAVCVSTRIIGAGWKDSLQEKFLNCLSAAAAAAADFHVKVFIALKSIEQLTDLDIDN